MVMCDLEAFPFPSKSWLLHDSSKKNEARAFCVQYYKTLGGVEFFSEPNDYMFYLFIKYKKLKIKSSSKTIFSFPFCYCNILRSSISLIQMILYWSFWVWVFSLGTRHCRILILTWSCNNLFLVFLMLWNWI